MRDMMSLAACCALDMRSIILIVKTDSKAILDLQMPNSNKTLFLGRSFERMVLFEYSKSRIKLLIVYVRSSEDKSDNGIILIKKSGPKKNRVKSNFIAPRAVKTFSKLQQTLSKHKQLIYYTVPRAKKK